ncbi:hypothetical protein [Falsiruegeria mediterranea]|uniref:Uncharacterized protein n=1 Tax=Falsiruegeria mediterranea M17 TaxID=1200281 RepID=A0A2R8CB18_9RHOB|nr:hypothetical protein [Falsiruegeria mediterranea]SPJ29595.1 hypothetical protein TRM7615_03115 [Falsiruegeria mediterranea M17]
MLEFRIKKHRNGTFEVDGQTFPDEATAVNMCIRMAQDLDKPYRIYYPL